MTGLLSEHSLHTSQDIVMIHFPNLKTTASVALGAGLALVLVATSAHGQIGPVSDDDKALYTIGLMVGQQLESLGLSDEELDQLFQGLKDQAQGKDPQVDPDQQMENLNAFIAARMSRGSEQTKAGGQAFLDGFVEDGGSLTDSGLAYKIVESGSGDKPSASDTIEVHYEGSLIDGTVFDSSYARGTTATFALDRVIAGWTEGLQLIAPGGKIQLVIPSDLGYGDQGSPPNIPGGATLVFEVELIDIK
ncbi:MAG: FKBP-type peptidyl-prolyl cis-trans isomerase [Aquisalimonadaceae bacterium]